MRAVAPRLDRKTIIGRLRAERDAGTAIYDALCGSGITAKMAARGGASMITTHALAYFRMQGMSSMAGYLPICDANALTPPDYICTYFELANNTAGNETAERNTPTAAFNDQVRVVSPAPP